MNLILKLILPLCAATLVVGQPLKLGGWTNIGKSFIKVFTNDLSWDEASAKCKSETADFKIDGVSVGTGSGHLVYEKTEEIYKFITSEKTRIGKRHSSNRQFSDFSFTQTISYVISFATSPLQKTNYHCRWQR